MTKTMFGRALAATLILAAASQAQASGFSSAPSVGGSSPANLSYGAVATGKAYTLVGNGVTTGSSIPVGTMRCAPGRAARSETPTQAGTRLGAVGTTMIYQALYAIDANGNPTGSPLVSYSAANTVSTPNAPISGFSFVAGTVYAKCTMMGDATGIAFGTGSGPVETAMVGIAGSGTFANALGNLHAATTSGWMGWSYSVTSGTWPNLTGVAPSDDVNFVVPEMAFAN